jgi:hypothetical protein
MGLRTDTLCSRMFLWLLADAVSVKGMQPG